MLPSAINTAFREWGINPMYGWDALELELDDCVCEAVKDVEHLRLGLFQAARSLIDMAVDESERNAWSSYFTWAVHIIDSKMPMTHTEMTLLLGEAARWHRSFDRPDYLYVVQELVTGRQSIPLGE